MQLDINGTATQVDAADDTPLLWVLRDYLGLTGTKYGCGMALCGACTVHIEGQAVRSCVTPISAVAGKKITTIEGVGSHEDWQGRTRRVARHRCAPVWLLPDGPDHVGHGATGQQCEADRCGHRLLDERQHLPLRYLSAHPRRHQASGRRRGRQVMSAHLTESLSVASLSRRDFLFGASALGGLVLLATASGTVKAEDAKKYGADGMPHGWKYDPLAFIAIAEDGTVTVVVHRSEMGQGVRTGMPLIIADELEADWSKVRVQQATANEEKYGNQDTDGSRSSVASSIPCVVARRARARCSRWLPPRHGVCRQAKCRRRITRSSTARAAARRVMAVWRRPPRRCPCLRRVGEAKSASAVPIHRQADASAGRARHRPR